MTAACKALAAALAGALALALNGCAGVATVALAERLGDQSDNSGDATGARPAQILRTQKFATDQPVVLEQIGVHYAYALGLSGDGVRIGIDDDFVDFTQRDEFEGRVEREASAGARLADNGGTLHTEILEEIEQCRERVLCEQWIQTVPLGTKYDITLEYTRDWMVATYDSAGEEEIENAIVEELVGFGLHEYLNLRHAILHDTHREESGDPIDAARAWATAPNPYIATRPTRPLPIPAVDEAHGTGAPAVDLYRDEVRVEQRRGFGVGKALALHHVAPVAREVADGDENQPVVGAGLRDERRAPFLPVHGVARVQPQVGRCGARQGVGRFVRCAHDVRRKSAHEREAGGEDVRTTLELARSHRIGFPAAAQPTRPQQSFPPKRE